MMEGPQKFAPVGLEGVKQKPREETLDRDRKMERAEIIITSMFGENMEATSVIRRIMEDNNSSFSGLEERNF